jgi:UDP-glucose 4-epimerase
MKSKSCIIYGGAGFIGSHIAEELYSSGFTVTVFDKKNVSRKNIEHLLGKIDYAEGDFNNEKDISRSLKNIDYVIHLVSTTLPADSNLNPFYDVETNLKSSLHLFEECLKHKIRKVIFISSGGTVYGNPRSLPISEEHPTNPMTSYGIIKLTIEKYLGLYKELRGLDYKILRLSNPFGERQNPKLSQGLIANLLYRIKLHKKVEIWGDGSVVRDFFYIRDGAKAIIPAIEDRSKNYVFNISSGKGYSINQILDKFRKELGLKFDVNYKPGRNFDVSKNILDNSLAKKYLRWEPKTDFKEALKKTWSYILDRE